MEKTLDKLYAIDLLGVLVNARDEGDFQGELLQLYSPEVVPFYSVLDLIKKMESFYDEWDYPQTACRDRSFRKRQKYVYANYAFWHWGNDHRMNSGTHWTLSLIHI